MYGELPLIDTTQGGKIPAIPIVIPNPQKIAVLRLPTAEETFAYTGTIRQIINRLGRRQSEERIVTNPVAERKLFDAIRLDKTGDEFDESETRRAIEIVLNSRVTGCEREGDLYVVKIATAWGVTVHTCRIPWTRELLAYRDNVFKSRDLPHNVEERRFPPDVPRQLYDAIITAVDGYAPQFNVPVGTVNGDRHVIDGAELKAFLPQIPPNHKSSVASEVSSALYDLDPQLDPNA
jgi:hypothetical protein